MSMLLRAPRKQDLRNSITNAIATTGFISIILLAINSDAAAPTTAVNAREFALLCTLVSAEDNLEDRRTADQAAKDVVALAAKIELILANLKHIERLAAAEPEAAPKESRSDETPEACKAAKATVCNEAAQIYKKFRPNEKLALAFLAETTDKLRATFNDTLKHISNVKADNAAYFGETAETRLALANIKKALYGSPEATGDAIIESGDSTRSTACGNTGSTAANSAKKRAAAALICLCSSDNTNANSGACFDAAKPDINYGNKRSSISAAWAQIKQKCRGSNEQKKVTAAQVKAATAELTALIHQKRGDKALAGLLGTAQINAGAVDCDGSEANGKGSCVILSTSANKYKVETPDWLTALEAAIADLEQEQIDIDNGRKAEAHILALNSSLTTLLAQAVANAKQAPPQAAAAPEKKSIPQKDCTKNTKKKDCKEGDGCKWNSTEATEGAFCKPKDGEGQPNAAGTEDGIAGAVETTGCAHTKIRPRVKMIKPVTNKIVHLEGVKMVKMTRELKCAKMQVFP
uniref:Variant surface glycoprotein 1125.2501 n=1 Tax=Trypanosoma brucei TaxID=5691 RepID=A0A1J0R7W8_9TRYP|nr:variant surface glycoprotein 1125.2501 [Trypanosoma brucei]